jgi:tetratricopeptide (TPR) repeat protein
MSIRQRARWGRALMTVALASALAAATADLVDRLEAAYQAGDLAGLETARGELLQSTEDRSGYYAAYARFRQAMVAADDTDSARGFIDDCIAELDSYTRQQPADAEARALLGSCYGISTSYYPLALVSRGLEARHHMAAARDLAPASPWVLLQDGLADFATPRLFGGSRTAAISKLERAAALFDTEHAAGSRPAGWAAVETWQQLALMYAATGQNEAATRASSRAATLPRPASFRRVSLR